MLNQGILLIGGKDESGDLLADVLLLKFSTLEGQKFESDWNDLPSLREPRDDCSTVYLKDRVFVASLQGIYHVECLNFPAVEKGSPQWTFLSDSELNPDSRFYLASFDERLLVISEFVGFVQL